MSIALCRRIWDRGPKGNDRFLLLCIGDHADESGHAYPSLERLAERCTLTKRSVISALNRLEKDGWVKRIKNGRKSEYQIILGKLGIGERVSPVITRKGEVSSHMTGEAGSPIDTPKGEVERSEKVKSAAAIGEVDCNPPTPPYRRTTKEPPYEPEEAVRLIVKAEPSLGRQSEVVQAMVTTIADELRSGARVEDLIQRIPGQWRKYSSARAGDKFEIRGWGPVRFFAEGYWKDEQCWPWKPVFRPERKPRYCDPATLYTGPEYQRRAEGA